MKEEHYIWYKNGRAYKYTIDPEGVYWFKKHINGEYFWNRSKRFVNSGTHIDEEWVDACNFINEVQSYNGGPSQIVYYNNPYTEEPRIKYIKYHNKRFLHRHDKPAYITYNEMGKIIREEFYNNGLHVQGRPDVITYNEKGEIIYEEYQNDYSVALKRVWKNI